MKAEPNADYRKTPSEQLAVLVSTSMDERACAELVRRYRKRIHFEIMKIVRQPEDAEDITIDSLARAFINIRQYSPEYKFTPWLYKIATNNAIDFLRQKKSKKSNNHISLNDSVNNESGKIRIELNSKELNPEELMDRKQRAQHLYRALKKLRPEYAEVVKLRYFRQYSYKEIAEKLNMPSVTIRVQIHRAKEELYKLLY